MGMSVDVEWIREVALDLIERKVADPNEDLRDHVWQRLQVEGNRPGLALGIVDVLNVLDVVGTFIGLHYATVTPEGGLRLIRAIADDVRFGGIIGGLEGGDPG